MDIKNLKTEIVKMYNKMKTHVNKCNHNLQ